MNKKEIIERLRDDDDYYGEFGQQFLSNSNIRTLLTNPADLRTPTPDNPNFKIGGYFHTMILEPDKLKSFKIVDATSRNTKKYKELSEGKVCILQHEVDNVESMAEILLANSTCRDLIKPVVGVYEEPGVTGIFGNKWKGKADIINHDEKLVIDLKTTGDISKFKWSASKFNYDSQAYIYKKLFGYDMLFIAIDKTTKQIGIFDCSDKFYETGEEKVIKASEVYDKFYKDDNFDRDQYVMSKTL
jgi:hypothetical protein|tara:strand:+ start:315 stop:1046 length:732 start_codon:yes stop_codon:yes gene_type:complete